MTFAAEAQKDFQSRRRISPKELAAKGWTPIRGYRKYRHRDGWLIEHCGHPTANWPYALYDPGGKMILAPNRRAWPTVASAVDYVSETTNERKTA